MLPLLKRIFNNKAKNRNKIKKYHKKIDKNHSFLLMSLLYLVHIHSVSVLYFGEQQGKQISSEPFS
jgi:hypothetical protein